MLDYFINRKKSIVTKLVLPAFGVLLLEFILINTTAIAEQLLIPSVIIAVILLVIATVRFSKLKIEFKQQFLVDLLNKAFDNVKYDYNHGVDFSEVHGSELLPRTDRFHSNDLIEASYLGVDFRMSDLHLQEVRRNGKNTTVVTVFRGPFITVDFNKDFKGKLQVIERHLLSLFSSYKRVKMESVTFNKKFNTYSTDDHSAYYILTPHIMEKFLELERKRPGAFYFSFINSKMYIALDNRSDSFELNFFGKIDESVIENFNAQLSIIRDVVEELKLNKDIFK